jgi:hypothetical protein
MKKKSITTLLAIVLILVSSSCQKKAQVQGVELQVGFSEKTLTDNLITEVQYKWKTASDFAKIGSEYTVFVHFWHKNNLLFQDDHTPVVPTTKWEPGKEYTYVRKVYIPAFIDEFDPEFKGEESLRMSVGFYSPYDRSGKSKMEVMEKKLTVVPPPPDTPEIIYENGWYDQEINPDAFLKQWRWTAKEAVCVIDNPRRDALLVIKGGVNLDALKNQKVIFRLNDFVLDEFAPQESFFEKSYNIKKEMLGDKDEFRLVVVTDQTFIPAKLDSKSKDERELGMQISFIYFR